MVRPWSSPASPTAALAAFHNVCRHRGPSFVTEWQGCGARKFTCPYHGWMYDTTGKVIGVPEKVDFDQEQLRDLRAPAVAVDEWGGWVWVNLAGPGQGVRRCGSGSARTSRSTSASTRWTTWSLLEVLEWDVPVNYKAIVDGFNEIYHTAALHHVGPEWTRSAKDTTFHVVNDHNYMCFVPRQQYREQLAEDWDHQRYAICHYVVFPNTVFNCNPEHVQVFQPIPIDVDRTRFLCWELVYPGDDDDPEYVEYRERMLRHWEHLKVVVGEDIDIYQQLARTKRSSAYTPEHPLVARVQDRALPREDGGDDQGLSGSGRRRPVSGARWPAARPGRPASRPPPATWPPRRRRCAAPRPAG